MFVLNIRIIALDRPVAVDFQESYGNGYAVSSSDRRNPIITLFNRENAAQVEITIGQVRCVLVRHASGWSAGCSILAVTVYLDGA